MRRGGVVCQRDSALNEYAGEVQERIGVQVAGPLVDEVAQLPVRGQGELIQAGRRGRGGRRKYSAAGVQFPGHVRIDVPERRGQVFGGPVDGAEQLFQRLVTLQRAVVRGDAEH